MTRLENTSTVSSGRRSPRLPPVYPGELQGLRRPDDTVEVFSSLVIHPHQSSSPGFSFLHRLLPPAHPEALEVGYLPVLQEDQVARQEVGGVRDRLSLQGLQGHLPLLPLLEA